MRAVLGRWLFAVALASMMVLSFAAVAYAEHPEDDFEYRRGAGELEGPDGTVQDPRCDEGNDGSEYTSLDFEWWNCDPDPGLPGVPGSRGWYWNPDPSDYVGVGGEVAYTKTWKTVPGTALLQRLAPRTEWVNSHAPQNCDQVACLLKTGADVNVVDRNGRPVAVHHTWLNTASQIYKWDTSVSPAKWVKVGDTGWKMPLASFYGTNTSRFTATWNWGTAPAGVAYYSSIGWSRQYNGSAWVAQSYLATSHVWDPPPGDRTPRGKKPPKLTAKDLVKPKKQGEQPSVEAGVFKPIG